MAPALVAACSAVSASDFFIATSSGLEQRLGRDHAAVGREHQAGETEAADREELASIHRDAPPLRPAACDVGRRNDGARAGMKKKRSTNPDFAGRTGQRQVTFGIRAQLLPRCVLKGG